MITFGYKSKFSSILRACAAIAVGLIMLIDNNASESVVKIIAAFLFAAGVVSAAHGYAKRASGALPLMSVNAIVDIILGIILFIFPHSVADLIPQLIGIAIIIVIGIQVVMLFGTMALVGTGLISFILAFVILIGGIMLVFSPFSMGVMKVLAGIFLIFYGISEIISMYRAEKAQTEYDIKYGPATSAADSDQQAESSSTTYDNVTFSSDDRKIDTSGLSDAKEVEFTKED